jgi:hypothetical protein
VQVCSLCSTIRPARALAVIGFLEFLQFVRELDFGVQAEDRGHGLSLESGIDSWIQVTVCPAG